MLSKYFRFEEFNTNYKSEFIGGITTFLTMAYIVIVNPLILQAAGIPIGPSMVATVITAFFGTLAVGIYANRPIAIAPYMGENAFIAFTVVKVLGYSWQTALGAIFIGGVLFTLITLLKIRSWLANSIPESIKIACAVGIGLFLTFIGLNETGIVTIGVPGAPVHVGNFKDIKVLLSILGFLLIGYLMMKKVMGAMLYGIIVVTIISIIFNLIPFPEKIVSMPPSISETFLKLDILSAFSWGFFAVILTTFVMDFVDTIATLVGLGYKAGFLDENGNFPEIEKPMLIDALSTVLASLLGTTTAGCYIESAAGIESGAKTGFASVVTALCFLFCLFFSPLIVIIPSFAYGPAIIIVGMLMITPITKIKFADFSETIPVFCVIVLMSFTYNIGIGMTAGFIVYPLMKALSGKIKEVPFGLWILAGLSLLFYIFYPY